MTASKSSWLTCFRMNTAHSTCEKVALTPIFRQASCATAPMARLISLPWFVIRLKARGLPSLVRMPFFPAESRLAEQPRPPLPGRRAGA